MKPKFPLIRPMISRQTSHSSRSVGLAIAIALGIVIISNAGGEQNSSSVSQDSSVGSNQSLPNDTKPAVGGGAESPGGSGTSSPSVSEPDDLIARSAIVCFGGNLTLVPKTSVLYIPPDFANRLRATSESAILRWSDFFPLNRGWITTFEVTQAQVEGKELIPSGAFDKMKKKGELVIATQNGDPVTVRPPQEPAKKQDTSNQTPPGK